MPDMASGAPTTATTQRPTAHVSRASTAKSNFWAYSGLGFAAMIVAWNWYAYAQADAQAEQPRALAANTTMEGFAELIGGVPLALAHLIGLGLLLTFGWRAWRWKGLAFAAAAVLAVSLISIIVTQLVWGGELFELGIDNQTYQP